MVGRVIRLVYKEIAGLHQAAYVLALFAFGSQLLALLRDRLLASQFGAGAELDIYYAAFRLPDLLFVLFASTLSVYVLIPFVTRLTQERDATEARTLLSQIMTLFLLVYAALALVLAVAAPYITPLLFPGIADQALLVTVLRILLLQPLLLGLSSLCGVVTQLGHRFVLYALSPLVYNLGIILGIVFLYPLLGLSGLAVGVVFGALAHVAIQWPLVRTSQYAFTFTTQFSWSDLRSVLRVSIPRAITLSLNQLVLLVLVGMASVMTAGSVSVFQFAFNLQSVPLAIIGVSYSVAAFPTLARLYAETDLAQFRAHIITALKHIVFWSVPVIVLCIVLRAQLVRVTLGTGLFNWEDTRLTAAVFGLLIVSLVAQGITLLLVRTFYAGGDTRTPLYVGAAAAGLAVALAFVFRYVYQTSNTIEQTLQGVLRVSEVAGTEVLVLAAAYSVAMLVHSAALMVLASYRFGISLSTLIISIRNALLAAAVGGITAYAALQFLVSGLQTDTFVGIFLQGLLAGVLGVIGVVAGYWLVKAPELVEVSRSLSRKIFKTDVIAPQKDVL